MQLHELVLKTAKAFPNHVAVKGPDATLTYAQLEAWSNRLTAHFRSLGVVPGDRVALWAEKGAFVFAASQAALRCGAAYVPVDPLHPTARVQKILRHAKPRVLFAAHHLMSEVLVDELADIRVVDARKEALDAIPEPLGALPVADVGKDGLAYILYTSGSTGEPKGVSLSHENALAFVDWVVATVKPKAHHRFSNHAPMHFDLSVLDMYTPWSVGAAVHIVPDGVAYTAPALVEFARKERITHWYSVPSALTLMANHGGLLEGEAPPFEVVFFAGEPFPPGPLQTVHQRFPHARWLNLYGPTETNVCTAYELTATDVDGVTPVPIGKPVCGDVGFVVKEDGTSAAHHEEGELVIEGPTVMQGYWGAPPLPSRRYATGDIVRRREDGNYLYAGRRDSMVKVRGFRVELGAIETVLEKHADVAQAVVLVAGSGPSAKLHAFVQAQEGARPTLLALKAWCAKELPRYMLVDSVRVMESLPRTRNGKVDRRALSEQLG